MSSNTMKREKDLTKNTLIITIGRVSTQFISFLLLPLYTALLSTEQYGRVDLITTLVQLLIPISSLMIDQGVFRYLLLCKSEVDKKITITSATFSLILSNIVVVVLYGCFSFFIQNQYSLWLVLILIVTSFSNLFLQIARGLRQTGNYAMGSFVCSVSTIMFNIICIVSLHMGDIGMLVATFIGNAICCIFLFIKLKIGTYISISLYSKKNSIEQLRYSMPLVPNQLSLWVMNSSDRLIVSFFLGTAANGILAVSHKFPAMYMTLFSIFQLAWHETGAVHYFDDDRDEFFSNIIKKMLSIFSTLFLAIIIALPIVFDWFVNSNYNEAYYNIPIYMSAFLFNIVIGLLGAVYVATKKTTEMAKTTMLAAFINIVVNILLIKYIGLYAASVSTFVSYFITMIYRIIDTKKYLKIKYDINQLVIIGIATVVCSIVYYLNNKVISILFLPVFFVFSYFFNKKLIHSILHLFINKIGEERFNKNKNRVVFLFLIIIIIFIGLCGNYIYNKIRYKTVKIQNTYSEEIIDVSPVLEVDFSHFDMENFTCTGLTYDRLDDSYWIADYGTLHPNETPKPRIIEIDSEFNKVINIIDISSMLDKEANLQGLCYDINDDSLWAAIGNKIVEINKEGKIINNIDLKEYSEFLSNGICYDYYDDTIWVLCTSRFILHYSKNGNLIEKFDFNFTDQDHIVKQGDDLLITVGADYIGNDNYICRFSCKNGNILSLYRTNDSYAIEGICIKDDKILIANDGAYHLDKKGKSYIMIYNLLDFE